MSPHTPNTISTPKKANTSLPTHSTTTSTSPASPQTIEKILRLCPTSFSFPRQPLFTSPNRDTIHRALGAVNRKGRVGNHPTVLKRVTLLFRLALQTHIFYPSFDVESKKFWTTVLSDVREGEPFVAQELRSAQALAEVVSVYTQAYANRHGEGDDEGEEHDNGFQAGFELLTPNKRQLDPKKTLISLVRVWAELFRTHKAKKSLPKTIGHEPTNTAINKPPQALYPEQLPNESDAAYIDRLKISMKAMATAEKAAQDEITELRRRQAMADEYNKNHNIRLHATLDRMDARLKQTERELRLERMGAGGEDDPWVPFRDYAYQLDGTC
ncbi:hypothetical protein N0V93_007868 [Gnomoniopsis smithogilvyi]|uniref:Uncharacterized protein n=1 Tax=Gnomoniopsis smithogilvyi TaxID=1191159 RepID=A0A9W8YKN3_9PEZI|nr:hypothetical protein N0V93_007868 [Gnomoniopsis smithogilvyi]